MLQPRSALVSTSAEANLDVTIGVSESVFGSWGASVLYQASSTCPGIQLFPHTHRSPAVLDRVRSGEYMLGLCSGFDKLPPGIIGEVVAREPMVLVGASGAVDDRDQRPVWSIEASSTTGKLLQAEATSRGLVLENGLETFFGVAQAALAGFAVGMVLLGVAKAMGIPKRNLRRVEPDLYRSVSIVGQKSTFNRTRIYQLIDAVRTEISELDYLQAPN